MAGADGQTDVGPPAGTRATSDHRATAEDRRAATEEGLASALSAFLAQLQAGFDSFDDDKEGPGGGPPVPGGTSLGAAAGSEPTSPVGATSPHRFGISTGPSGLPANRVLAREQPKLTGLPLRPNGPLATGPASPEVPTPAPFAHTSRSRGSVSQPSGRQPVALAQHPPALGTRAPTAAAPVTALGGATAGGPGSGQSLRSSLPGPAGKSRPTDRARAAAILLAAILLAALGASVAWGRSEAKALNTRTGQLVATQGQLGLAESGLQAARDRVTRQLRDIRAADAMYRANRATLRSTKAELAKAQSQLGQLQSQLTQAQDRVGQAQSQLGDTQSNLSATQAHAAQCQQGAALGSQFSDVLGGFIVVEDNYLTALQSKQKDQMKKDLAQMESLNSQAQVLGPAFSSAVATCAKGG